jgi:purine nucleosidase
MHDRRRGGVNGPIDLIFDTDPGKDDAFAIFLALAARERLNVLALLTAAGNLGLDVTSVAARRIVEAAGRPDIPVYRGCPKPLLRKLETIPQHHGADGLGGSGLPDMQAPPRPDHAVDVLINLLDHAERPVTLAAIAPLTNLAVAFTMRPDLARKLDRLVIMGGARGAGNMGPFAEFNIYVDPHAAEIVFGCGADMTLVPLDVTRPTLPDIAWFEALAAFGAPGRALTGMWCDKERLMPLHDVTVTAYLLWPELFTTERCAISVELADPEHLGQTHVVPAQDGMVNVVTDIDRDSLYTKIELTLRKDLLR